MRNLKVLLNLVLLGITCARMLSLHRRQAAIAEVHKKRLRYL